MSWWKFAQMALTFWIDLNPFWNPIEDFISYFITWRS